MSLTYTRQLVRQKINQLEKIINNQILVLTNNPVFFHHKIIHINDYTDFSKIYNNKNNPKHIILDINGSTVSTACAAFNAFNTNKTTCYIPYNALSGGTIMALGCDKIITFNLSIFSPIDPKIVVSDIICNKDKYNDKSFLKKTKLLLHQSENDIKKTIFSKYNYDINLYYFLFRKYKHSIIITPNEIHKILAQQKKINCEINITKYNNSFELLIAKEIIDIMDNFTKNKHDSNPKKLIKKINEISRTYSFKNFDIMNNISDIEEINIDHPSSVINFFKIINENNNTNMTYVGNKRLHNKYLKFLIDYWTKNNEKIEDFYEISTNSLRCNPTSLRGINKNNLKMIINNAKQFIGS